MANPIIASNKDDDNPFSDEQKAIENPTVSGGGMEGGFDMSSSNERIEKGESMESVKAGELTAGEEVVAEMAAIEGNKDALEALASHGEDQGAGVKTEPVLEEEEVAGSESEVVVKDDSEIVEYKHRLNGAIESEAHAKENIKYNRSNQDYMVGINRVLNELSTEHGFFKTTIKSIGAVNEIYGHFVQHGVAKESLSQQKQENAKAVLVKLQEKNILNSNLNVASEQVVESMQAELEKIQIEITRLIDEQNKLDEIENKLDELTPQLERDNKKIKVFNDGFKLEQKAIYDSAHKLGLDSLPVSKAGDDGAMEVSDGVFNSAHVFTEIINKLHNKQIDTNQAFEQMAASASQDLTSESDESEKAGIKAKLNELQQALGLSIDQEKATETVDKAIKGQVEANKDASVDSGIKTEKTGDVTRVKVDEGSKAVVQGATLSEMATGEEGGKVVYSEKQKEVTFRPTVSDAIKHQEDELDKPQSIKKPQGSEQILTPQEYLREKEDNEREKANLSKDQDYLLKRENVIKHIGEHNKQLLYPVDQMPRAKDAYENEIDRLDANNQILNILQQEAGRLQEIDNDIEQSEKSLEEVEAQLAMDGNENNDELLSRKETLQNKIETLKENREEQANEVEKQKQTLDRAKDDLNKIMQSEKKFLDDYNKKLRKEIDVFLKSSLKGGLGAYVGTSILDTPVGLWLVSYEASARDDLIKEMIEDIARRLGILKKDKREIKPEATKETKFPELISKMKELGRTIGEDSVVFNDVLNDFKEYMGSAHNMGVAMSGKKMYETMKKEIEQGNKDFEKLFTKDEEQNEGDGDSNSTGYSNAA